MVGMGGRGREGKRQQFAAKPVKPLAGLSAYRDNAGVVFVKKGTAEEGSYLGTHFFETARADGVYLGDHGKTAADSKQAADGEMLFGLRLDAFFGRDDKQDSIDAA